MDSSLLSYSDAAGQVHRFIVALATGGVVPATQQTAAEPSHPELIPLENAAGRVLAVGIHADRDQPPFARSTRDGFACRAAEANSHQYLFLAGQVRAGQQTTATVGSGEIWEIMTGAPVPQGADCVLMLEHVEHSSNFVRQRASRTIEPGENIVAQGAEARAGDLLVPPGIRITAAQIAMAAQCGYRELAVYPRPRVAILSTGDEIVPLEETPGPSQIRNSNTPMLAAMVTASGGTPVILPPVPDRDRELDEVIVRLVDAQFKIDMLLVTGGISVGRFDLVADALTRAGAGFFFGGVAIQPGKPVVFGQLPRTGQLPLPFFALPGNPISSAVTFQLFAAPLLAALADDTAQQPRFALARLEEAWHGKPGLTRFLPAWCDFSLEPTVRLIPWQGSGDLAAFATSNCCLVIPQEASALSEGSVVQILLRP
jgi:molybdopterin molybdotransferase